MAKDLYHETVKEALINDGWTITHDPLRVTFGTSAGYIDLGAERLIGATKDSESIAVEIKSFLRPSLIEDLQKAVGQYVLYKAALDKEDPQRTLYLAVPSLVIEQLIDTKMMTYVKDAVGVKLVSYSTVDAQLVEWIR